MSNLKSHRVVVRSAADLRRAQLILHNVEISADKPIEVIVQQYERKRSYEQNRLYWKWLGIISADIGQDIDSLHMEMKMRHLVPIVRSSNPLKYYAEQGRIKKMYDAAGQHASSAAVRIHLADTLSTTDLTQKKFTAYLEQVELFAAELGITLTNTEDK